MHFQCSIYLLLEEWRLFDAELDAGAELNASEWSGGMPAGGCAVIDELLHGS